MFAIDFTKPYLYKDVIYFHQGNLSTNNTLRCSLNTGGSNDLTGCTILCTFKTQNSIEISGVCRIVDPLNAIVDLVFPSNALVVGTNKLEILVNRVDGSVAQSPSISYDIWQGLTTGNGVEAETNYPILIELINSVNKASNQANATLDRVNAMQTDVTDAIDNAYRSANEADIATSNANAKIEEVETSKLEMIKKVDTSIETMKLSAEDAKTDMQATTDAKMQQVDNSISNMKVETNTAIDNMVSKTDEKITDVNRAIAAGTKDLEVKEARKDASGVVHDTLDQRLKSDLIVGDKSLKDFVIDMNGMKETQDLAYETNTGYKVCNDTQVGAVKDLKLCGKSLVNIADFSKVVVQGGATKGTNGKINFPVNNASFYYEGDMFGQLCTAIFIPENNEKYTIHTIGKDTVNRDAWFNQVGIQVKVLNNSEIYKVRCYSNSTIANSIQCYIVRGDVSQNPPQYFEGIASVGNGKGIEALSNNSNLFDYKDYNFNSTFKLEGNKIICNNETGQPVPLRKGIYLPPNATVFIKAKFNCIDTKFSIRGSAFKGSLHQIDLFMIHRDKTKTQFKVPPDGYVNIGYFADPNGNGSVEDIMISFDDVSYIPFKQDKKPVLYKDIDGQWKSVIELRGVNNICDTIENSKYTIKTAMRTLNGGVSENWKKYISTSEVNTIAFSLPITGHQNTWLNDNVICNLFKSINNTIYNTDIEGISLDNNGIIIKILRSKLSSEDVEGFKKWLQANNVTIIYPLLQEKVYEVNPLELESFDNITLWLILSGVIAPPASFKITSSLPNFVKNVDTRVKRMENDFYKYTVTQNRMQLGTTYSSDRTTFRVDTATFSTEKAKQDLDYDLFRLLKHNIIVGPQNYDKAEMENIMDFYVSVGKIDYNMWDELYMLIEEQHNPSVEEEAPVI